jgi:hypothetical protein
VLCCCLLIDAANTDLSCYRPDIACFFTVTHKHIRFRNSLDIFATAGGPLIGPVPPGRRDWRHD